MSPGLRWFEGCAFTWFEVGSCREVLRFSVALITRGESIRSSEGEVSSGEVLNRTEEETEGPDGRFQFLFVWRV